MSDVNGPPEHMAYLLNRALRRLRGDVRPPASLPALTTAQARILDVIPAGGCRIVDLSGELQVSKQGLGQLVGQLATGGYVEVTDHAGDRRAKVVRRTPEGDRVVRVVRGLLGDVEERWRQEVGPERYAVFRDVLAELVRDAGRDARGAGRPPSADGRRDASPSAASTPDRGGRRPQDT